MYYFRKCGKRKIEGVNLMKIYKYIPGRRTYVSRP